MKLYIALSQNSMRRPSNYPRRNNYPRGRAYQEFLKFFRKNLTAENTLSLYIETNHALPNAITYLNTCIAYLNTLSRLSAPNTCIAYLNTLSRLSAPNRCIAYVNTLSRLSAPNRCIAYLNTLTRLHILIHCRLGNQSESRTPGSRQSIRIYYYVTRVVSQSEASITSPELSLRHPRALG